MTTENVELESVKNKIRALSRKTVQAGCTEQESKAAMKMVGKLLNQYELSMNEVSIGEEKCGTFIYDWGRVSQPDWDGCYEALARLCNCHKHWENWEWKRDKAGSFVYNKRGKPMRTRGYAFFGFESDALMAIYLCQVVDEAMKTELAKFKKTDPEYLFPDMARKSISTAFTRGMTYRLETRMNKMRKERDKEMEEENKNKPRLDNKTTTELVVLKNARVDAEYKKLGMKLVKVRSTSVPTRSAAAFNEGVAAADRVNLSRPVETKGRPAKGLLA